MKTNPLRIFQSFTSLSIPARYLILSNFITNIGNGIHILIVGKLLYDITGTLMSFAFVIIFEYVIKIILQLFAGSMVDKGNPKRIALISDFVRGIILILAGFFLSASSVYFLGFIDFISNKYCKTVLSVKYFLYSFYCN